MRSEIQIVYHATRTLLRFNEPAEAEAAYQKVARALDSYRSYGNDKDSTVEIVAAGGPCTLRLDRMDAVLLDRNENYEAKYREALAQEKWARDLRAEAGLPDAP